MHANRIAMSRLPAGAEELIGRETELDQLDRAWQHAGTQVVSVVAMGGQGKTSLVADWVSRFAARNWEGVDGYFDWSFYSQGTRRQGQASADTFIDSALRHFGEAALADTGASSDAKARRLVDKLIAQRCLLVLDGLEPLQEPQGRLKDSAICSLLVAWAQRPMDGLCVVTTRELLPDLEPYRNTTYREIRLKSLSPEAGAVLLFRAGVNRSRTSGIDRDDKKLLRASHEFNGHALTLKLLGRFVAMAHDGDILQLPSVRIEQADELYGGHAFRVMESYEGWLEQAGEGGRRALAVLRMLGLFDRPARRQWLAVLREPPAIEEFTEPVVGISEEQWNDALKLLAGLRLIDCSDSVDTHPLVREYFASHMQKSQPAAWREAHSRIFGHLKETTVEFPESLIEMAPLFAAVDHGCHADRHQDAYDLVYVKRISRGSEHYAKDKLGAVGQDLAALASFIQVPWSKPVASLKLTDQVDILVEAGIVLRLLGRMAEAEEGLSSGLSIALAGDYSRGAARACRQLSEFYLDAGRLDDSLNLATQAVSLTCADQTIESRKPSEEHSDADEQIAALATRADVHHQLNDLELAEQYFDKAAAMQKRLTPDYPRLQRLRSFRHCDLLIDLGRYSEAQAYALDTLGYPSQEFKVAQALDKVTIAKTIILVESNDRNEKDIEMALKTLDEAVASLSSAGQKEFLVRGRLAQAEMRRIVMESTEVDADMLDASLTEITETMEFVVGNGMVLHEADCHIQFAGLHLLRGHRKEARSHFEQAKRLVARMHYHRRNARIAELETAL